jgi:hypothetical protein
MLSQFRCILLFYLQGKFLINRKIFQRIRIILIILIIEEAHLLSILLFEKYRSKYLLNSFNYISKIVRNNLERVFEEMKIFEISII